MLLPPCVGAGDLALADLGVALFSDCLEDPAERLGDFLGLLQEVSDLSEPLDLAEALERTDRFDLVEALDLAERLDLAEMLDLAEIFDLAEALDLAEAADLAEWRDTSLPQGELVLAQRSSCSGVWESGERDDLLGGYDLRDGGRDGAEDLLLDGVEPREQGWDESREEDPPLLVC